MVRVWRGRIIWPCGLMMMCCADAGGVLCWLVGACWAVSIGEQGWPGLRGENLHTLSLYYCRCDGAADMSLRHAARCTHMGFDRRDPRERMFGHWPCAKAHRFLQESKRCLGSTDLLVCIGEMCATASPSEGATCGHGRGHQRDTTVTAQLPS